MSGSVDADLTTARPRLTRSLRLGSPRGIVLMLHGGAEHGLDRVGLRSAPWLRQRAMMAQLRLPFHRAGLDTWLLRYRVRGWNPGHEALPSPVSDARWALEEVRRRHGSVPVVLLGHSMGGRTGVAVADDPSVVGVVGLAPWLPADEPVAPLAGRHLVAAHGHADRITSLAATSAFVRRARPVAASAELVDMGDLDHAMLRGSSRWNAVARDATLGMFAGR